MVPTVQLTGDATTGLTVSGEHRRAVAALPTVVKLGRIAPKARPQALRLEAYMDRLGDVPIPASQDWYTKAAPSVARMYLNDRYGDCVFAGKAHCLGIWSANDPDSTPDGSVVLATDQEISQQYFAYTGGRDTGAVISEVLDLMRTRGFVAGGKSYKITGYVAADPRNQDAVKTGIALFGTGSIGINLPGAWANSAVWDMTNSGSVGGHDVSLGGYGKQTVINTTKDGVIILSWGRLYLITWQAFTSGRYVDELYFAVPEFLWTGKDGKAPNGADLSVLLDDLAKLGSGTLPPLPDPNPPAPPPSPPSPPPPPAPVVTGYRGQTDPFTLTVPTTFGHGTVNVPAITFRMSPDTGRAGESFGFSWLDLWNLIRKGGPVIQDVTDLLSAWQRKDFAGMMAAAQRLISDLGLDLSQVRTLMANVNAEPPAAMVRFMGEEQTESAGPAEGVSER